MIDKLKNIVNKYPDRVAYSFNGNSITYIDLWDKASYYASLLTKQGVDPVIIYGGKEINMVISILACIMAKRTYVPIGKCMPISRFKKIIKMTNSTLVISDLDQVIDNINWMSVERLEKYNSSIQLDSNNLIAYIIFTSGSTGEPKGVPISYDNLNNFINWISSFNILRDYKNINVLNQASFSFDLSVADFYYSLCNGHTLYGTDFSLDGDLQYIYSVLENIDFMVVTPTFMKLILLDKEFNSLNYLKLKCIYFCGEILDKDLVLELWDRFPNLNIINAYGPTEATSAVSGIVLNKNIINNYDILPVGDMNNNATIIEIIDGEIVLKGPSVFNGYLGNINGGFYKENNICCYKTGDIGYIENGLLFCNGRFDSQIKYKGYRIELLDIENHIKNLDGIKDACVVAKKDDNNTVKMIKGYVVLDNSSLDSDSIKKSLEEVLPFYMIPKTITILDQLPLNCNGKIDRTGLSKL